MPVSIKKNSCRNHLMVRSATKLVYSGVTSTRLFTPFFEIWNKNTLIGVKNLGEKIKNEFVNSNCETGFVDLPQFMIIIF